MCLLSSVWWHSSIVQPDTLYRTSQPPILRTFRPHNPCKRTDHFHTFQLDMLQKFSSVRSRFALRTLEGMDLLTHQISHFDSSLSLLLSLDFSLCFHVHAFSHTLSPSFSPTLLRTISHENELPCLSHLWLSPARTCARAPTFACARTRTLLTSLSLAKFHLCTWSI